MNIAEIFVNKLKIETKVVSIDSLFCDDTKVKKTQFAPPYQRNYVWDGEKATYFIESLLIGTEIPPLIFFRNGSKLEIIDGRQRYETILRFVRGELRLSKSGLKKLDSIGIDKKTFVSLPDMLRNDFLDTKLRIIEFSFVSLDGITKSDEDSVKQEIFKRYNSGITPLKTIEIDKAIYFEDDLNSFFKCKLQNECFYNLFTNIFKYEDVKVGIALKKIRQLLVLHKIPIKYYSISKQKITDKYYDLLSSQITPDKFPEVFESFKQKLELIENIRTSIELTNISFNRLISEVLFWAFSILEDNGVNLSKIESNALKEMEHHLINNISVFKMDRSSFANEIVTRFSILADYLQKTYNINRSLYIETGADFKRKNRELNKSQESNTKTYQELRINKPEPTTYTIDDICRLMNRSRFIVRPLYQREEVINKKKSSEIIESLLLGIKLPPIFIFKNAKGVSEVIDGQQRILSILAFLGRCYLNENGDSVKSNKNEFALQLKDSILSGLSGRRFSQLTEVEQEKIANFDLWIIEINERNNPDFEPLDLFIRLNNKPYPIKDDTFEMWNSYIDRGLINTIRSSYKNNSGWFFLRKLGNRMENENNYTVLSYFNYLKLNQLETTDKGPLDIYKVGSRIAFRLRSKGDISKVLENTQKHDAFTYAVNNFEFSFLSNLKYLLIDDGDYSDKALSSALDDLMGIENGKRTQQSFYVLWYFLNDLELKNIIHNRDQIRKDIRHLFDAMSTEISVEKFNQMVRNFHTLYSTSNHPKNIWCKIVDILTIHSLDTKVSNLKTSYDFCVNRDNKLYSRILVVDHEVRDENFYACQLNRGGFSNGYIVSILRSSYIFNEYDFKLRNITINSLQNIKLPLIPIDEQLLFDKVLAYTHTKNESQKQFFETLLDKMVEEVYHKELFDTQNISILKYVEKLESIYKDSIDDLTDKIDDIYARIVNDEKELMSNLSAITSLTGSHSNKYEKDN